MVRTVCPAIVSQRGFLLVTLASDRTQSVRCVSLFYSFVGGYFVRGWTFFFFTEKSFGEGCKSLYVLLFRGCCCSQKLCQFLNGIFSSMKSNISLKKNARKRESRVLSRVKMKQRNDGARSRNIPPNFHLVPFFARKFIRRAQYERRSICKP